MIPRIGGSTSREITVKTRVRLNERIAEIFPFESAVKNPDDVMLSPLNRKLNAKIGNPVTASESVFGSCVNTVTSGRESEIATNRRTIDEAPTKTKEIR